MRAVITYLPATGSLPKTPTISPDWEQEGLSCAAFNVSHTDETMDEPNLATTIVPVVTRKGKQRMLHRSQTSHGSRQHTSSASPGKMPPPTPVALPSQIQAKTQRDPGTPAVITRKGKQRMLHHPPTPQQSRQPPPPTPPGAKPTPTPVSPLPRTLPMKQKNSGKPTGVARKGKQRTRHHPPALQKPKQPPPTAPPEETPHSTLVAPPPRTRTRKRRDQGTPEPMLPTQETATSADTALSQGEHQSPYPTMVQRIADLFRKPRELMAWQREDSHLLGKVRDLNNGGTGGEYVTDDDGLLWYAPPGSILRLAIPRSLVPTVLAFVHTTYGHPGVARTTELTQGKYHWTSLKSDVRNYVLSCLKRSTSQRITMLPARFPKP